MRQFSPCLLGVDSQQEQEGGRLTTSLLFRRCPFGLSRFLLSSVSSSSCKCVGMELTSTAPATGQGQFSTKSFRLEFFL